MNMRYYRTRQQFHLGDRWARLNCALRLIEKGEDIGLWLPDAESHQILSLLDYGEMPIRILSEEPVWDAGSRRLIRRIERGAYDCRYFPTKVRHNPAGSTIGIAADANWRADEKIPPDLEDRLSALRCVLDGWEFVRLGRPHQHDLSDLIRVLSTVQLLVSVDNGVAHVSRSVRVPLLLIHHRLPVSRGFPPQACHYVQTGVEDLNDQVVDFCRRLTGPQHSLWK
jgi:hypothetical protein